MPLAVALVPLLKSSSCSRLQPSRGRDKVSSSARPASSMVTLSPRANKAVAALTPVGPEPMMKCSSFIVAVGQLNHQQVRANVRRIQRDAYLSLGSWLQTDFRQIGERLIVPVSLHDRIHLPRG